MAAHGSRARERADRLNESPSQKEGKLVLSLLLDDVFFASMKALPKRKGNGGAAIEQPPYRKCLNESPSQKEGKFYVSGVAAKVCGDASMKALPKRKGNSWQWSFRGHFGRSLNESPSQKEGKLEKTT